MSSAACGAAAGETSLKAAGKAVRLGATAPPGQGAVFPNAFARHAPPCAAPVAAAAAHTVGLSAARVWPLPPFGLGPLLLAAGGLSLVAAGAARLQVRGAWIGWSLGIFLAGALAGFALLHLAVPGLHEALDRPPREVTVTIEVRQLFPPAPTARSLTGLGRIIAAGEHDRELVGRRVYFAAIRRISVPPQRSGRYLLRGVIEPLPPDPSGKGFNAYLENLGIRQRLTRAQIVSEVRPPGQFQRFCVAAENRLETILRQGLEKHPQTLLALPGNAARGKGGALHGTAERLHAQRHLPYFLDQRVARRRHCRGDLPAFQPAASCRAGRQRSPASWCCGSTCRSPARARRPCAPT